MNNLRPDELASQSQIEYAKKGEKVIKKGIGLAAGALGIGATSKVLPFLSELIPSSLAIKGLKKVNPRIGEFVEKTMDNGFSSESVLGFLRDKFGNEKEQEQQSEEQKSQQSNPLKDFETNYPELAQGLMNTIQAGQSPQAAAGILKTSTALGKQVKKLEKEVGKNFVDYVLELFGPSMQQSQTQQPPQQPQMQQPQQQNSGLDGQILAALDKILKM